VDEDPEFGLGGAVATCIGVDPVTDYANFYLSPFEIDNTRGRREFAPPTSGVNQDWVLVLDDAKRRLRAGNRAIIKSPVTSSAGATSTPSPLTPAEFWTTTGEKRRTPFHSQESVQYLREFNDCRCSLHINWVLTEHRARHTVMPVWRHQTFSTDGVIGMTGQEHNARKRVVCTVALTLVLLFFVATALGHDLGHDTGLPTQHAREFTPTPVPDRIVLTWTGNPSLSQAVTWRTSADITQGIGEIAVAGEGPLFAKRAQQVPAQTVRLEGDLGPATYHTVEFTGLTPKTQYAYRVGDGTVFSEWSHFTTANDWAEPFTFVYVGDAQNDIKSHWSRVIRSAFADAPKAAFILHAGDLINRANRDTEWGQWFYATGFLHRMIPCLATPGNHEYARQDPNEEKRLSAHWRPTFAFPEHGPEGLRESVYYIDYQGMRIISLNSNERQAEQVPWLRKALQQKGARWTIVTFHHPLYASAEGRDNTELRDLWQPILDEHRVDLVLQGHDHTYARSGLMMHENVATGAMGRSGAAGTVYVVSVSGPKMYDLGQRPFMKRVAEDTQLYQIIRIDGDQLHYQARTATGRLYDGFTLIKRDGRPNQLIEKVPNRKERRRLNGNRVE
jgi:Calcineurin-like phosphoesterase/Purple acid Phosphatase, N-terminal domain